MKKQLQKILSVLLAVTVLFSSMSFTLDLHYCGNELSDVFVLHEKTKCEMLPSDSAIHISCHVEEGNCCSDRTIVVDGQDVYQTLNKPISFNKDFLIAFTANFFNFIPQTEENRVAADFHSPPIPQRSLYQEYETYII